MNQTTTPTCQAGSVGVVVIGRNEGERLRRCLASVIAPGRPVIYVDSGSTDGSIGLARSMDVEVVELAVSGGFTAARARNAGFERLMHLSPALAFVQFVDGDCEVDPGWIGEAATTLVTRSDVAVVCGRRRERFPAASIYNRLCDLEWDTRPGETTECGGDAMMRIPAFTAAGGYDSSLIAGEEPELCVRLRLAGWKILRLDREMTLHDAAMTRFEQWWKRNVRAGFAFAEGAAIHGRSSTRHWVRQANRNWIWGAIVPLAAMVLAWPTRGISIAAALAVYLILTIKVYRWRLQERRLQQGGARSHSAAYAVFCTISKFPQVQGQLRYLAGRVLRRRATLIEYKANAQPQPL